MSKLKKYFEDRKKWKIYEKEAKKKKKAWDKEIDKEYKELYCKKNHDNISNKLAKAMANFFDVLWPDDEEQQDNELSEYLTAEEKQKIEDMKKDERKTIKKAIVIYVAVIFIVLGITYVLTIINRTHYQKVTEPMIKEYFKNHYNQEIELDNNSFICYEVQDENKNTKEECTNLLVSTTSNRNHVITIDDKYVGDDLRTASYITSYEAMFEQVFANIGIVTQKASLSYQDFYHDFNPYLDYINILPIDVKYEDLYNSNKLVVIDRILYQGEVNPYDVQSFLQHFGDDSSIYLIKVTQGLPSKLTIVSKNNIFEAPVSSYLTLNPNVTYYELDRSINSTNSVTVTEVSTHGISESINNKKYDKKIEYQYQNGRYYKMEYDRPNHQEEEKPHYVLLKYSFGAFPGNFILFNGSNGNYKEEEKEEYPLFITMSIGSETYVITDTSFGLATKTEKKEGFLCNFGLC